MAPTTPPLDPDSEEGRRVNDDLGNVLAQVELRLARERREAERQAS